MSNSSHSLSVSIVVPFYGASAHIGQCAESLLSQTYPNIEFVFVNDGTKDDSIDILRSVVAFHPERKAKVIIVEKENQGVALARKTGISHVKGDYVIQIDADDWVETDMVDRMVNVILATGADLVYTDYYLEFPDRQEIAFEKEFSDQKLLFKDLYNGMNFHCYYWIYDVVSYCNSAWNSGVGIPDSFRFCLIIVGSIDCSYLPEYIAS